MRANQAKNLMRAGALSLIFATVFFAALAAQSTGRPKVLVLPPDSDLNRKVVESFQWDLAKALDKSGLFDIVSENEYKDYLKENKMGRIETIPDSAIPQMMETFQASIYTSSTLSQENGKGTEMKTKVDFIFPKNEYTIKGEEHTAADEKQTEDLANQAIQIIIRESEKISAMSIARSYFNSAIYNKAIENYEKLLKHEPDDVNCHYMIATSYLKMDSTDIAISQYERILAELDPEHIPTREILANTYYSKENHEKALEHYRILAEKNPDDYGYTQYWAFTLVKLERKDEALDVFNRLVQIKDEDKRIRMQMGSMEYAKMVELGQAGDSATAKVHAGKAAVNFARAVELCNQNETADLKMLCDCLHFQALSLLKAEDSKSALKTFSKLVEIDPSYLNAYYYMGATAYKNKQYTDALNYFYEAIKYAQLNTKTGLYQQIGRIHQLRKEYPQAIEAFTNALKTANAKNKNLIYFLRGLSYHDHGNVLDYAHDEDVDMDELIEAGRMTKARVNQAVNMYGKAEQDLSKVTGRYAKSAKQHIARIAQLRERVEKIKQQIDYYEKTK